MRPERNRMIDDICSDCIPGSIPHRVSMKCVRVLLSSNRLLSFRIRELEACLGQVQDEMKNMDAIVWNGINGAYLEKPKQETPEPSVGSQPTAVEETRGSLFNPARTHSAQVCPTCNTFDNFLCSNSYHLKHTERESPANLCYSTGCINPKMCICECHKEEGQ